MTPPKYIYRYQPPTIYALSNLSEAKLWFSDPASFNDPFDCLSDSIIASCEAGLKTMDAPTALEIAMGVSHDIPEALTALSSKTEGEIIRVATNAIRIGMTQAILKKRGVCCFSENRDDLLMWAHYADSHRGFCLEFDTSFAPFSEQNRFRPIDYRVTLPALDLKRLAERDHDQLLEFLHTKASCWKYEREWRALHREPNTKFGYDRAALNSIYFGAKMGFDQIEMICSLLDRTNTRLFKMSLDINSFQLSASEFKYTPIDFRVNTTAISQLNSATS